MLGISFSGNIWRDAAVISGTGTGTCLPGTKTIRLSLVYNISGIDFHGYILIKWE